MAAPSPPRAAVAARRRRRLPLPLPAGLPPRFINADQAAQYVGVSTPTFLERVKRGLLPAPVDGFGRRKLWDLRVLDRWMDRLSGLDDPPEAGAPATVVAEPARVRIAEALTEHRQKVLAKRTRRR